MRIKPLLLSIFLLISIIAATASCSGSDKNSKKQFIEVVRGNIVTSVISDGNLVMPHEVILKFGTPGTIKKIYVEEGDRVKAGTLLAKEDDTLQQLAVMAAQYDVEFGLNELAERVYPALLGYPHYYPSTTALYRIDQAIEGLNDAEAFLKKGIYADVGIRLRVASHDLQGSLSSLKAVITDMQMHPEIAAALRTPDDPDAEISFAQSYPSVQDSIDLVDNSVEKLQSLIGVFEKGEYKTTASSLAVFVDDLKYTRSVVDRICGRIVRVGINYPDASTSVDVLRQVQAGLSKMQELISKKGYDEAKLGEQMRIVEHDLATSRKILEHNDLLFKHGLNLKALRQYNINLQKAEVALQKAKEDLMKTEILAPFDGVIVNIGVKENDQLSAYDYSTRPAIHLVDTSTVKMEGVVDEIDIFKVKTGQKAVITLDALPGKEFTGKVTFISPFSTQIAGVVNFPITIALDKTDIELKGGLTATANIVISGHENVPVIPTGALQGSSGSYWVEVLREASTSDTEKRNVVIGIHGDQKTEIVSGLKPGEKVLVPSVKTR
jgi:RND family efflux transporter MFP subunit